jgi:hypothetical protein|tara:strand:+ start:998 stop:1117 length:120 start_codon:yes stop_codon:yes gene_type:complete
MDGLPDIPMTWFEWFRMSDGSFRREKDAVSWDTETVLAG